MVYKTFGVILGLSLMGSVSAQGFSCQGVHTWHQVHSNQGRWQAKLQMLTQNGEFYARDCSVMRSFALGDAGPVEYGFAFAPDADFDVSYTLTLTEDQGQGFTSKACVYVITAKGPAQPDIRVNAFNGAQCNYKVVPGVGEDFSVS